MDRWKQINVIAIVIAMFGFTWELPPFDLSISLANVIHIVIFVIVIIIITILFSPAEESST